MSFISGTKNSSLSFTLDMLPNIQVITVINYSTHMIAAENNADLYAGQHVQCNPEGTMASLSLRPLDDVVPLGLQWMCVCPAYKAAPIVSYVTHSIHFISFERGKECWDFGIPFLYLIQFIHPSICMCHSITKSFSVYLDTIYRRGWFAEN